MTNEEKLSKALRDFKTKYPSVTSADLQTFIIGWQEAAFCAECSGYSNHVSEKMNDIAIHAQNQKCEEDTNW